MAIGIALNGLTGKAGHGDDTLTVGTIGALAVELIKLVGGILNHNDSPFLFSFDEYIIQ
jgi:hypothetical protein